MKQCPLSYQWTSEQKFYRPEENGMIYSKCQKKKKKKLPTKNPLSGIVTFRNEGEIEFSRQTKAERIHHNQTFLTRDAERNSSG